MRLHCIRYSNGELKDRVIWGRSFRWAARIRHQLRIRDCVIEESFIADIPGDKSGLIKWLNANFRVMNRP